MTTYTQDDRSLVVTTPLGKDALLLVGVSGYEAISQLFNFQLELLAVDRSKVDFSKLLGQPVIISVERTDGSLRHFNGMCSRFSQGAHEGTDDVLNPFTHYRMEVVPTLWLLTKRTQSRIFQQKSVPDILKEVLSGIPSSFELQGTFEPRDYCVQYRETDFNFLSRLMEEEGIYYFFKHSESEHRMVIANTPQSHKEVVPSSIMYEAMTGGNRPDDAIWSWEKSQEIRSGKVTLWDHCFELPHKHLDASEPIQETIAVGTVTHKFSPGESSKLELYDYPGEYAQRFDGVSPGGGDQGSNLQKIFQDNSRTTKIRMQQEAVGGINITAMSNCRQVASGFKFTLDRHIDGNGDYVVTAVNHSIWLRGYRSGEDSAFGYENNFSCIPAALPFRPPRTSPRPVIVGTQTALVVGPSGEEIFTDKYGRVKIQFHWDRQGQANEKSSCWVRVAQDIAGKKWGSIFLPRVGQEVIIAFEEGDMDRPIIIGSVYNASEMPPYKLPDERAKTVLFKSYTYKGGGGFNEIRIDDTKGSEQIFVHGQRNSDTRIKADVFETIGNERHLIVGKDQFEDIKGDKHQKVKGDLNEKVDGNVSLTYNSLHQEKVKMRYALDAGQEIHLKAGMTIVIESGTQITLKVGGNFITLNPAGVAIKGSMVLINSGGSAGSGSGASPDPPKDAKEAAKAEAGQASQPPPAEKPPEPVTFSPMALSLQRAAQSGAPFCDI